MELAQPRMRLAIGGALAALAAGGLIAFALVHGHRGEPATPPPASKGGLVIDASGANVGKINPAKPLRCFVGGRFVGDLTLPDCAQRNGVATDALDVGVDASGALAAGQGATAAVAPPAVVQPVAPVAPAQPAPPPVVAQGDCWRYADQQWRKLPSQTSLNGCAQALFAGRCQKPGTALYGRWGQQTLRLVPGRVEISADNKNFHTLVEQGTGCSIPTAGG
jgi:hypothetical protein